MVYGDRGATRVRERVRRDVLVTLFAEEDGDTQADLGPPLRLYPGPGRVVPGDCSCPLPEERSESVRDSGDWPGTNWEPIPTPWRGPSCLEGRGPADPSGPSTPGLSALVYPTPPDLGRDIPVSPVTTDPRPLVPPSWGLWSLWTRRPGRDVLVVPRRLRKPSATPEIPESGPAYGEGQGCVDPTESPTPEVRRQRRLGGVPRRFGRPDPGSRG